MFIKYFYPAIRRHAQQRQSLSDYTIIVQFLRSVGSKRTTDDVVEPPVASPKVLFYNLHRKLGEICNCAKI
jgi:hypothetical protein